MLEAILGFLIALALALPAGAQTYQDRPIKLFVPLASGSAVVSSARRASSH